MGVFVSAGLLGSKVTDNQGSFSFSLPRGSAYQIKLSRTGWVLLPSSSAGSADADSGLRIEAYAGPPAPDSCTLRDITAAKLAIDTTILDIFNSAQSCADQAVPAKRSAFEKRKKNLRAKTLQALKQNLAIPEVFLSCPQEEACLRADLKKAISKLRASASKQKKNALLLVKFLAPAVRSQRAPFLTLLRALNRKSSLVRKQILRLPKSTYFCS